jgi:hypothetical protein
VLYIKSEFRYTYCIEIDNEKEMKMTKIPRNVLSVTVENGVTVTVYKPRKTPKSGWMSGKTTRSASTGTSGFAVGFPRKTTFGGPQA